MSGAPQISQYTTTPNRATGRATYSADADTRDAEQNSRIVEANEQADWMNDQVAIVLGGARFASIAEAAESEDLEDGKYYNVSVGTLATPETIKYDADSTATADGALIVNATGMGAGRLVSTRTVYADFDELDADARFLDAGTKLHVLNNGDYEVVLTGEDATLTGGLKVVYLSRKASQPHVVDLFVPYGQSNAQGQPALLVGALPWINPKAEMYDGTNVIPLTNFMPTPNGGTFGGSAWQAFANEYIEKTGRRCVFVNCAKGSQSIADLAKGGSNYTNMVGWVAATIADIEGRGDIVGNVSILFNQGERDQQLDTPYEDYYSSLAQLWTDIKADTPATKMFIWTLGLYLSADVRGAWAVQQAQRTLCASNADVVLAYDHLGGFNSSNGLSDNTHYTMAGYNLMGREGAKTVAGVLFDGGAESAHLPAQNGTLLHASFQRQHRACATLTKAGDGTWNFGNTTGPSGSFIAEIDSTTDTDELRLKVSGPLRQYLEFSAQMDQEYAMQGLEPCPRINYDTDQNADDYIAISFRMQEIPLRVKMVEETIDLATLSSEFSSLFDSVTASFPSTGNVTITHPTQYGLPVGAIRGADGKMLRVNSSGFTTTYIRLRDESDALVDDEVACCLRSVAIPLDDVPVGAKFSIGLTYSTYIT